MHVRPYVVVVSALIGLTWSAGARAQSPLIVDGTNSPFTVSTPQSFSSLTVASGGNLVVNAAITVVGGDVIVQAGGTVTHDIKDLDFAITAGTIHVQAGGTIDVINRGFRGAHNGSAF